MTGTGTKTDLAAFLLARITEDKADIEGARISDSPTWWEPDCWSRERALAECDAKRRLVEELARMEVEEVGWDDIEEWVMSCLALPYAGHDDYQQEWKPWKL
jgi:hypothetical protein